MYTKDVNNEALIENITDNRTAKLSKFIKSIRSNIFLEVCKPTWKNQLLDEKRGTQCLAMVQHIT